ncbi:putative Rho-type GTPase-activating protein 2 [Diplogelasinospora grovesii]|uniref:Rho-type GTPase-activating protein 2 n=1 Tax=Diplogelasinospora grovesii TaxID=303347 RepID=A0AAN6N5W1_9PEZI|nr:putative Rho-type GTPase-activating protein 2 [Diplogelasinospora grovesii]
MGRKPVPQPLTLADPMRPGEDPRAGETAPITSSTEPKSPRSPRSPFRFGQKKTLGSGGQQPLQVSDVLQRQHQQIPQSIQQLEEFQPEALQYPPISSAIQPSFDHQRAYPPPGQHQQHGHRHNRRDEDKASKSGFFSFNKSSRSTDRLHAHHQYSDSRSETMSRDSDSPALSKQNTKLSDSSYQENAVQKPIPSFPSRSEVSLASTTDYEPGNNSKRGTKPKPFTLLGRSRSIKDNDRESKNSPSPKDFAPAPVRLSEPERAYTAAPLRTAPIHAHDRSFREMMSSAVRNHSAERSQPRDMPGNRGREQMPGNRGRDHDRESRNHQPSSFKENSGSAFLSGLKNSKAADIISKGLFGKGTRHENAGPKEPIVDDEHYVLKVINLPLVEQTRRTRISKRLEHSRDKTEFWMPAFPWRAIDYLNYKGSDVEGLYRIPGSGPQIKKWQRKFDEEGDVDLFEQTDLYDINIIGSMLKAWLRELPDELFPKSAQERIARECTGAETVPQLLIEELSNLSPFNYYLLFAITCHLSLLLAHSDKNKMDFRNLCICFQPCMKIDAFCFKFLVCDWRDCWKGCKNEAKYIEEEYALFDQPPPRAISETRSRNGNGNSASPDIVEEIQQNEERNVSSSDGGSKNSNRSASEPRGEPKGRLRKKNTAPPENFTSVETSSTVSTTLTVNSDRDRTEPRGSGDLRLSPIKPLSPLGF